MAADTQSGNGYSYARNNPLKYTDPSGFKNFFEDPIGIATDWVNSAGRDIEHFVHEGGKWIGENWRTIVVVAVVIVVTIATLGTGSLVAATLGDAILAGMAAGAAGAAVGAALYGGTVDDVLQAAIKGAISGAAFYGVGSTFAPTEQTSMASQIESMAAHGAVGGPKSAAEGGDFWKGFMATAATKASSLHGPRFDGFSANAVRAAVVGGTVASLSGDKFANGAITGVFSYAFNDYAHQWAAYGAVAGGTLTAGAPIPWMRLPAGPIYWRRQPKSVSVHLWVLRQGTNLEAFSMSSMNRTSRLPLWDPTTPPSPARRRRLGMEREAASRRRQAKTDF